VLLALLVLWASYFYEHVFVSSILPGGLVLGAWPVMDGVRLLGVVVVGTWQMVDSMIMSSQQVASAAVGAPLSGGFPIPTLPLR
jgi:hypothetical protein